MEETNQMKLADKAILGMVSESPGRNVSEPTGGLVKINPVVAGAADKAASLVR